MKLKQQTTATTDGPIGTDEVRNWGWIVPGTEEWNAWRTATDEQWFASGYRRQMKTADGEVRMIATPLHKLMAQAENSEAPEDRCFAVRSRWPAGHRFEGEFWPNQDRDFYRKREFRDAKTRAEEVRSSLSFRDFVRATREAWASPKREVHPHAGLVANEAELIAAMKDAPKAKTWRKVV